MMVPRRIYHDGTRRRFAVSPAVALFIATGVRFTSVVERGEPLFVPAPERLSLCSAHQQRVRGCAACRAIA